ncbi:DMP19 family protein (plasmid) [Deinococcus taeanensis]|uniref:DMP19 family protein n=1 Tax=Deinococcus taeanensis TaxID=2737050 RepID=UPI001CDC8995|nr:DMP19 family protein [Deinococcus taeanensis]UBV45468.1 DMP19 family protein [Deinococcus taeanensis]
MTDPTARPTPASTPAPTIRDLRGTALAALALCALRTWGRHESKDALLARLPEDQRLAVMAWWMDGQTKNGSFVQWHVNGLSGHAPSLAAYYAGKGPHADQVAQVLRAVHAQFQAPAGPDVTALHALSGTYFGVADQAIDELSAHLTGSERSA